MDWLREVLLRLPNLQSLIVRGLPFFDHAALNALKFLQADGRNPTFGLRLLDASRCGNLTAVSLCHGLGRFPSMLYLDLSFTCPAREHSVLKVLRHMTGLQILKLRGIFMRDEDVEILAQAISTRVRSLDLRNNQLTDRSVRTLLDYCFTPSTTHVVSGLSAYGNRSPSLAHYLGAEMLAIYQGEQFEDYLRNAFTTGFVSRLAIEDTPESGTGISHLYIADNQLTVEGTSGLLRSGRLHVLDIGAVKPDLSDHPSFRYEEDSDCMMLPGAEKLTPVLAAAAGQLTFLRIDHRLITQEPTPPDNLEVVPGRVELDDTSAHPAFQQPVELPGNEVYELSAEPSERFELTGNPIHVIISPAMGEAPITSDEDEYNMLRARRGSAVAPEVVDSPQDEFNMCKARRGSSVAPEVLDSSHGAMDDSLSPVSAYETLSSNETLTIRNIASVVSPDEPRNRGRPRTYSSLVGERNNRMKTHISQSKGYHPGVLPSLVRLVFTDVPPFSPTPSTADRLIAFIHDCAEEARLAQQEAQLDYSAPPGRAMQVSTVRNSARNIFALQEVVLEVARDQPPRPKGPASAWRHHTTKSMTQDRDSEVLASAAESDFSFFGEYDDDMPSLEPSYTVPFPVMSGLEVAATAYEPPRPSTKEQDNELEMLPRLDVIAEVANFRSAKKAAYQSQVAVGDTHPQVEGYWDGNIKVVRPSHVVNPMDEDADMLADNYGNIFSNGYLYK